MSQQRVPGCPKRMVYGPCGGVRVDGECEMIPHPCVFDRLADLPDRLLGDGEALAVDRLMTPSARWQPPLVLTDLSVPPADAATLRSTARLLAPSCDAVLVGDHQDRVDFPPSTLARLIADADAVPWVTLACRDRNRVSLEQELHALALDQLATVLCVTGDGRAYDVRPEVSQAFDLDGTRLAALAARLGLSVAVVETPTARPVALRPRRLVHKQQVGQAGVGVLNHVPSAAMLVEFLDTARAAGLQIPVIASVVVFTDERSAKALAALPGLEIAPERLETVLTADDPVAAGIAAAVDEAVELLGLSGVAGVNLSGLASARGVQAAAEIQAEIGHRIRAARGVRR
ncbi:methylenetetrahydrofolate reductase [Phycicoccus sp. Root101]|nr:methylenetetrahydrofolate reductase [Phycicoccus sp. Root101]